MVTYMEKLTVERKGYVSVFKSLVNVTPLSSTEMSEAASLAQQIEYLDRELAKYNGKQPLMSRLPKSPS